MTGVFRIDRFRVPHSGRAEFLRRVLHTHAYLRTLPGCQRDEVLAESGEHATTILTIVEWRDHETFAEARAAVAARHKEEGFDPGELTARLQVEAQRGTYTAVPR